MSSFSFVCVFRKKNILKYKSDLRSDPFFPRTDPRSGSGSCHNETDPQRYSRVWTPATGAFILGWKGGLPPSCVDIVCWLIDLLSVYLMNPRKKSCWLLIILVPASKPPSSVNNSYAEADCLPPGRTTFKTKWRQVEMSVVSVFVLNSS